jgi:Uma2 family endonuclease
MALPEQKLSVEEYLELEKHSELRHEYVDGELLAMAREKRRHNHLVRQLILLFSDTATQKGCELVAQSVKVQTRATRFRYPSIALSCAPGGDDYILAKPCLIVEVTSHNNGTSLQQRLQEYTSLPVCKATFWLLKIVVS